jgi:hypothetical protein
MEVVCRLIEQSFTRVDTQQLTFSEVIDQWNILEKLNKMKSGENPFASTDQRLMTTQDVANAMLRGEIEPTPTIPSTLGKDEIALLKQRFSGVKSSKTTKR